MAGAKYDDGKRWVWVYLKDLDSEQITAFTKHGFKADAERRLMQKRVTEKELELIRKEFPGLI